MKTPFFTGTGDDGVVRIGKSERTKGDQLFDVLGNLDEMNGLLGWTRSMPMPDGPVDLALALSNLQEILFVMQAEVATKGLGGRSPQEVTLAHTDYLEAVIAQVDELLPPVTSFILPGGTELSARLDIARARVRLVERNAVRASKSEAEYVTEPMLKCLNRFSSVLFALARYVNFQAGMPERGPSYELSD